MRHLARLLTSLVLGLALAACGGGGGASGTASVQGKVVLNNTPGQGVQGLYATCVTTGQAVLTGADGSFRFTVPTGEQVQVRITDAAQAPAGSTGGFGCGSHGSTGAVTSDGSSVVLDAMGEGEIAYVEVELRDGQVVECWIGDEGAGTGQAQLFNDPFLEPDARGELGTTREGDCLAIDLTVAGLTAPGTLRAVLYAWDGETELGTLVIGVEGVGSLSAVACGTDLVPNLPPVQEINGMLPPEWQLPEGEDMPAPPELDPFFGASVVLFDAQDRAVLFGVLPGPGFEPCDGYEPGTLPGEPTLPDDGSLPDDLAAWLEQAFGNLLAGW